MILDVNMFFFFFTLGAIGAKFSIIIEFSDFSIIYRIINVMLVFFFVLLMNFLIVLEEAEEVIKGRNYPPLNFNILCFSVK